MRAKFNHINFRDNFLEMLLLFSDVNDQNELARTVGQDEVFGELQCIWFDDFYNPDDSRYISSFSINEKEQLAQLSKFFDGIINSNKNTPWTAIQKSNDWIKFNLMCAETWGQILKS